MPVSGSAERIDEDGASRQIRYNAALQQAKIMWAKNPLTPLTKRIHQKVLPIAKYKRQPYGLEWETQIPDADEFINQLG